MPSKKTGELLDNVGWSVGGDSVNDVIIVGVV